MEYKHTNLNLNKTPAQCLKKPETQWKDNLHTVKDNTR